MNCYEGWKSRQWGLNKSYMMPKIDAEHFKNSFINTGKSFKFNFAIWLILLYNMC